MTLTVCAPVAQSIKSEPIHHRIGPRNHRLSLACTMLDIHPVSLSVIVLPMTYLALLCRRDAYKCQFLRRHDLQAIRTLVVLQKM